jgi:hypothetical protein
MAFLKNVLSIQRTGISDGAAWDGDLRGLQKNPRSAHNDYFKETQKSLIAGEQSNGEFR